MVSILIIEDELPLLDSLMIILQLEGYHVVAETTGQEGLETAQAMLPDLILSNVRLPDRSGLEVLQALQHDERTRLIPVILMSAHMDGDSKQKVLGLGARHYVTKPFDIEHLLELIRTAIGQNFEDKGD